MFYHQIKETREAVKDSESGLEKMSIGHHIQDRGHVVEKKFNKKTGGKEFNQDFQNMDECMLKCLFVFFALRQFPFPDSLPSTTQMLLLYRVVAVAKHGCSINVKGPAIFVALLKNVTGAIPEIILIVSIEL